MRLANKVALITGAAAGQGAAEAQLFASEGAKVVLADIQDAAGEKLARAICAGGGEAMYAHLDVRDEAQWRRVIEAAVGRYGFVDVLVNNAGTTGEHLPGGLANVEETSIAAWDEVMAINARGPFLGTKFIIPVMRAHGGGSIVNISSIGGIEAHLGAAAYAMSKSALRMLTKSTAVQFGRQGIRCNVIMPGLIETDMIRHIVDAAEVRRKSEQRIGLGRFGRAEEIARCVLFLASDEASFVTGAELVADGGTTAGAASVAIYRG